MEEEASFARIRPAPPRGGLGSVRGRVPLRPGAEPQLPDRTPLALTDPHGTGQARDFDAAIAEYRKALDSDPDFWAALSLGSLAHSQAGQHDEGVAWASRALGLGRTPLAVAIHRTCMTLAGQRPNR